MNRVLVALIVVISVCGALAVGLTTYYSSPSGRIGEAAPTAVDLGQPRLATPAAANATPPQVVSAVTVPQSDAAEVELVRLRERVAVLEAQLTNIESVRFQMRQLELKAALEPDGQIGQWALSMTAPPDEHTQLIMASLLYDYPVELQPEEGLWLIDRIEAKDWYLWGPSADEAIIQYFDPARIAEGCTPMQLAHLKSEWAEAGYFKDTTTP